MGKAYRAPEAVYTRTFVISGHAIERFRERVEPEMAYRETPDLGNLLDERMRFPVRVYRVVDTVELDAPTQVFEIEDRYGKKSAVVVRDLTAVTVLSSEMVEENFENGRWTLDPADAIVPKSARPPTPTEKIAPGVERTFRIGVPEIIADRFSEPATPAEARARPAEFPSPPSPAPTPEPTPTPGTFVDPVNAAAIALGAAKLADVRLGRVINAKHAAIAKLQDELAELQQQAVVLRNVVVARERELVEAVEQEVRA